MSGAALRWSLATLRPRLASGTGPRRSGLRPDRQPRRARLRLWPPLPARAITSESDIAPLVDRWWQAPPGSWAHAARHVVTGSGCAPELLAVGLANDNKKLLHQRAVPVPASVLADPRTADAAHSVVRFRRLAARAGPPARKISCPRPGRWRSR